MSGTKRVTVDLNEQAKTELAQILTNARTNASELAKLSNLLGQLQSLEKEIEQLLSSETSYGFRTRMENFRTLIKRFTAMFQELRSKLDKLKLLAKSDNPIAARDEATQLQTQITRLTSDLQALATEIKAELQGIEESIAAEVGHIERQADRKLRAELNGLLEELKMRLHPATALNFQTVVERANALLQRIERACRSQSVLSESEVRECKMEFADLVREVEEQEEARQKQWAIFTRFNDAFEGAGFYLATPVNMPAYDKPIKAQHVISEEEYKASVNTMVYNESITLEMWGASGEDSAVLVKDAHCPANMDRIIEQALRCGLNIKKIVVKNPRHPQGWEAMVLPGFDIEESKPVKTTKGNEVMKAKELPS